MDLIDSRQLRAFQELAREGSFTEAAVRLHLTQSAVSHSIKALENQLGSPLFERLGKNVKLTAAGESLLPHAAEIISKMQSAFDEVQNLQQPGFGRLKVGATVSISQYLLPSIFRELRESFPNFEISVITDDTRNLLAQLEQGQIDIAIALESGITSRLTWSPLFVDRIEMALSPMHPLARLETITPEDLACHEFIYYSRSSETYRLVEKLFGEMKIRLRASIQVGSMAAIKEMAQIGMGVGLLSPWIALQQIEDQSLVFRSLPSELEPARHWGIYQSAQAEPSLVTEIFTGICRNVVDTVQLKTEKLGHRPPATAA